LKKTIEIFKYFFIIYIFPGWGWRWCWPFKI